MEYKRICYGDLVARLDSNCPDGTKCDVCKINKALISSLDLQSVDIWFSGVCLLTRLICLYK